MGESSRVYYPVCRAILEVVLDGFGPTARDTPPKIIDVLPKRATVHKNSYSQADSWSITFDSMDLPIDPELIRAGGASIFLFQVPGVAEDQRIVSRQTDALTFSSGRKSQPGQARSAFHQITERFKAAFDRLSVEYKNREAIRAYIQGNPPIVAGVFDEHALELNESGGQVTISGQDYTDVLAKLQWKPTAKGRARPIPVGKRLDLQLAEILREADPGGRLKIELRGIELDKKGKPKLPKVGERETRGKKRGIPVEQDTSYWDVMTKLAQRYSLILFVDGLSVVLSRPKNITGEKDTDRIRKFAWGENLQSLNLKRKLSKQQVPQIIVQGYDDRTRELIDAKFPDKGDPVPTGIGVKRDEFMRVQAYGVSDKSILKQMAEARFHALGRSERTVTFATRDLTDMREDNLLDLATGDPVYIQFDTDSFRQVIRNPDIPSEAKVSWLLNRGYKESIARLIAEHYRKLEALSRPLRVKEVSYSFDANTGISIECEANDFIVIGGDRLAVTSTANAAASAAKRKLR